MIVGDFSCYVTLQNQTDQALTLVSSTADNGSFGELDSPIAPQSNGNIVLHDPPVIPEGSQGSCVYQVGNQQIFVNMSFSDPWSGSNTAQGYIQGTGPYSLSFEGASESPGNWQPGGVPSGGHPVYVVYTLTQSSST